MPDDFDAVLEQYHQALDQIVKGDAEPLKALWSNRDEVTLANPWGPAVRGWKEAAARMEAAATHYTDGKAVGFDKLAKHQGGDLMVTVEVEKFETKIDGRSEMSPVTLRCTSIFRREDGTWKVIHRHADPITTPRTGESLIQSS
jgi:ketosteroid isomerase-like protein